MSHRPPARDAASKRLPHAATVQAARPPHPATIVQPKPAMGGPAIRPPHPATIQRRGAHVAQRSDVESKPEVAAKGAVKFVKSTILWGAGNVKKSVLMSKGRSKLAFEQGKKMRDNRDWRQFYRKLGTVEKIFARAAAAAKAEAGNCEEHADLTFVWLYENAPGLTLNYAGGEDHAYVIIGDPKDDGTWLVVDPWPYVPRIGGYKVACQKVKQWEIVGVSDRKNLDAYKEVYKSSLSILPKPKIPAKDLPAMEDFEEVAEEAYDVN